MQGPLLRVEWIVHCRRSLGWVSLDFGVCVSQYIIISH